MTICTTRLVGHRSNVAVARRFVETALEVVPEPTPPTDVADVASLMVSELVTNAVRHTHSGTAGGTFRLTLAVSDSGMRVEVRSGPPRTPGDSPHLCHVPDTAEAGRGLALVDMLATEWGALPTGGYGVYFLLKWSAEAESGIASVPAPTA